MIIYNKSNNSAVSIDGRTMAPQTLTSDLFTKLSNKCECGRCSPF